MGVNERGKDDMKTIGEIKEMIKADKHDIFRADYLNFCEAHLNTLYGLDELATVGVDFEFSVRQGKIYCLDIDDDYLSNQIDILVNHQEFMLDDAKNDIDRLKKEINIYNELSLKKRDSKEGQLFKSAIYKRVNNFIATYPVKDIMSMYDNSNNIDFLTSFIYENYNNYKDDAEIPF